MEFTGHITEDLLIAYFSGEMDADRMLRVDQHILNCLPCQQEFKIYKTLFTGLIAMMKHGDENPEPSQLRIALKENLKKNQIFYSILHIPEFSSILVARSPRGLVNVIMGACSHFEFEEKLKTNFPRQWIIESLEETGQERRQFEEYFFRQRRDFDLPIDPILMKSDFQRSVLFKLQEIPFGHFVTYGAIARQIGKPKASRAVGMALSRNPLPIILPCHRVVSGKGRLGGFSGGLDLKLKLLQIEGVQFPHSSRQLDLFHAFKN